MPHTAKKLGTCAQHILCIVCTYSIKAVSVNSNLIANNHTGLTHCRQQQMTPADVTNMVHCVNLLY